jgi:cytochrome c peroxidase
VAHGRTAQKLPNGKVQYTDANRVYIMLPTDLALLQDPKTAEWVARYAANSPLFFKDFAAAYSKLLALGTATDSPKGFGV